MSDTNITDLTAAQPGAEPAEVPQFDRATLFQRSLNGLARLERMYDAARKRIERAKRAEDYLAYLIGSKYSLIHKLLGLWFTPDDLADVLIEELGDIPVARKKIVAAIRKCQTQPDANSGAEDANSPKKRRGRPPKSSAADGAADNTVSLSEPSPEQTGGASAEKAAASVAQSVIASAKNSQHPAGNSPANSTTNSTDASGNLSEMSGNFSGNSPRSSEKTSAKDTKTRTQTQAAASAPASVSAAVPGQKEDSEERKQRFRQEAPSWVHGYGDHPQYGPIVARLDGEADTDYFWRMWHTAPPWADEQPRSKSETETRWIQKCWLLTSPEERAAHQASLPTTAR